MTFSEQQDALRHFIRLRKERGSGNQYDSYDNIDKKMFLQNGPLLPHMPQATLFQAKGKSAWPVIRDCTLVSVFKLVRQAASVTANRP